MQCVCVCLWFCTSSCVLWNMWRNRRLLSRTEEAGMTKAALRLILIRAFRAEREAESRRGLGVMIQGHCVCMQQQSFYSHHVVFRSKLAEGPFKNVSVRGIIFIEL